MAIRAHSNIEKRKIEFSVTFARDSGLAKATSEQLQKIELAKPYIVGSLVIGGYEMNEKYKT